MTTRRLTLFLCGLNFMTAGCSTSAADEDAGGLVDPGRADSGVVVDAGPDAGPDAGLVDAGLVDAGLVDAGLADAGLADAGLADAGLVDAGLVDAGPPVVIDFEATSSMFPPSVNKIGFNSFWNSTSNDSNFDAWTIRRSAAYRAPMISGLIEPKSLLNLPDAGADSYEEWGGDASAARLDGESCSLWQPGYTSALFLDNAGVIQARTPSDPDLVAIRSVAQAEGLITFLQISGTPGIPTAIPRTTRFNGLFTLDGATTTGGNWYPLPIAGEFPALAHAFGTLPDALGYAAPTIYSFWQEPSHTIDEDVNVSVSINRYTTLYAQVSNEIVTQCRWQRCPMAGAQLNSNDGDVSPADGARYKLFIDALLARRAANSALEMPLDYFTIQNYSSQWNDNIIENSRLALGTGFPWTPVMMNEWDYCVNTRMGDGCAGVGNVGQRYDSEGALTALHWLVDSIDRPDVSHVLLRETVLQDKSPTGALSYPWTQVPILFLASMSEFRRPARTGYGTVPIIATGDDDQLRILLWNEGNVSRTIPLELRNLPGSLNQQVLSVKKISKRIREANCPAPADVMNASHVVTCWQDAAAPTVISGTTTRVTFDIAPEEAVMIFAGAAPTYGSTLFTNHHVRSADFVKRDGTTAAPRGLSHFDPRTGSATVAIRNGGDAAEKLTLRNLPNTLTLSTRFASMGAPSTATVAGIRVDYLDANKLPIKTVFFRDNRWTTATTSWVQFGWPVVTGASVELAVDLTGANRTLDLATNAPMSWAGDAVLGVVLSGAATDATWRVDFP